MEKVKIKDIITFLDGEEESYDFGGSLEDYITGFSSLSNYKDGTITWIKNEEFVEGNKSKNIKFVVLPILNNSNNEFDNYIITKNPKRIFFKILEFFYGEKQKFQIGFNNTISETANIDKNVSIGNNCTIGDNVKIGEGTIILNNVIIDKNVLIGKSCFIKSGSIIGEIGFGYSSSESGHDIRVPHFGSVVIGNNVDIGANTTIERGTMDNTILEDGVKVDDLCQISHNVHIGKNTKIITHTSVFGSVTIGENCYISTSQIRNQITIGKNVIVGMGAVVVKDVEDNKVVAGVPAKVIRDNF